MEPSAAGEIGRRLPPFLAKVGVFVNEPLETIIDIARTAGLDTIQLHGDETPDFTRAASAVLPVIMAARVRGADEVEALAGYGVSALVVDAFKEGEYGGTGRTFEWNLSLGAKRFGPLVLSGGLDPENVAEAVRMVKPYAVDVSSGVESAPGVKDHQAVRRFIKAAKEAVIR